MSPCEVTFLLTALANALAEPLTDDEVSYLAAILVQLGDTLATIVASRGVKNECQNGEIGTS